MPTSVSDATRVLTSCCPPEEVDQHAWRDTSGVRSERVDAALSYLEQKGCLVRRTGAPHIVRVRGGVP